VLKASHMRKWMRERLQRRKKSKQSNSEQPAAPPPLQPAYFDAEQPVGSPDNVKAEPEPVAPVASEPAEERERSVAAEVQPIEEPAKKQATQQGAAARQFGRGRRRRGGRGRGGAGRESAGREQAVAHAFAPKGSIGGGVAEPIEELQPAEYPETEAESPAASAPAPAPQIPAVPAAPQRAPKGIVVLAIGLPGSGKSSWFKRHNVTPLSSDMMRNLLFDDVREQRYQDLVFSNLRSLLKARLIAKRPMNYVDATNLTPKERQHWIKLAKDYNYEVHAVFFDVPLQVCVERHQRRDRVVPEDAMRRMAAKLKPPTFEEGFAKITVVRVKKKGPEAE
jgi:predicted kinase